MAATITPDAVGPGGGRTVPLYGFLGRTGKIRTGSLTGDTSYPTGGYDLSSETGVFNDVLRVFLSCESGTYLARYDPSTKKVLLYSALGTEVSSTTDVHTVVVDYLILGN